MKAIRGLFAVYLHFLRLFRWLPPLIARLSVGGVFIETGWGKLHNLEKFSEYLTSLHIPAAAFQAPFVAGCELVFGLLVVFGLLTRIAVLPLIVIMTVAILTAKSGDITMVTDLFAVYEYLFAVLLFWLAVEGPGPISIDRLFLKEG